MTINVSIDDGNILDLRAAALLEKYKIRGTFFIPVLRSSLDSMQLKELSKVHEIGSHTMTHPMDMKLLSDEDLMNELVDSKDQLEQLLQTDVPGFCYPRGRFDQRVKQAVIDTGYEYARTVRVFNFKTPVDRFEIETSLHFFPYRAEYAGRTDLLGMAEEGLKTAAGNGENGYFHLWFHTKEIEEFSLWPELEEAFKLIAEYKK